MVISRHGCAGTGKPRRPSTTRRRSSELPRPLRSELRRVCLSYRNTDRTVFQDVDRLIYDLLSAKRVDDESGRDFALRKGNVYDRREPAALLDSLHAQSARSV